MTIHQQIETHAARPTPSPLTSTILDHATVVEKADWGLRNNAGLYPSYNCLDMRYPTVLCPTGAQGDKTFDFASWVPAFDFAIYGGVQCKAVGLDKADMLSEVQRVFGANEHKGVEEALRAIRFSAQGSYDEHGAWADPVDLTPSGKTITPLIALALLEGYAAANYAGLPTIHMPRAAATILWANGMLTSGEGGKVFTKNGSKVAMGGGYDTSELDGSWDLFATGEVYVERTDTIEVNAWSQTKNDVLALAERLYRVGVDCFVAKATGTVF